MEPGQLRLILQDLDDGRASLIVEGDKEDVSQVLVLVLSMMTDNPEIALEELERGDSQPDTIS